jgi:hypothetical protein
MRVQCEKCADGIRSLDPTFDEPNRRCEYSLRFFRSTEYGSNKVDQKRSLISDREIDLTATPPDLTRKHHPSIDGHVYDFDPLQKDPDVLASPESQHRLRSSLHRHIEFEPTFRSVSKIFRNAVVQAQHHRRISLRYTSAPQAYPKAL